MGMPLRPAPLSRALHSASRAVPHAETCIADHRAHRHATYPLTRAAQCAIMLGHSKQGAPTMKSDHWYICLQVAAQNVEATMVQEILMYQDDGRDLVWC